MMIQHAEDPREVLREMELPVACFAQHEHGFLESPGEGPVQIGWESEKALLSPEGQAGISQARPVELGRQRRQTEPHMQRCRGRRSSLDC